MVAGKMDSDVIRAWSVSFHSPVTPAGRLKGKMETDSSLQAGMQVETCLSGLAHGLPSLPVGLSISAFVLYEDLNFFFHFLSSMGDDLLSL